ncbi:ATP-binding protein [Amycolatopsis mongoliensis]|uniref:ATP-binding protein n=1 Tax=Amycolatopsis mongoliensis TaxID=715475 RepID=A0A9Y2JL48_9PSEU|nr:ATP-binding protein [Amycolatopsis sp. 4-36]WIY00611.1 ATP-binding protein [Amycolatopsis sp. 4-36]
MRTIPTRELGTGADQPALIREWAQGLLAGLAPDSLADAVLVLDELVSNALCHGAAPVRVRLAREVGHLRFEVTDASSRPARRRLPDVGGGRGLMLVDACSRRWGQWWHDAGKTVWAELAVALG